MKKVVLYCDRCGEEKETPAASMAWIRVAGMGRALRYDLCSEHIADLVGMMSSRNGEPSPPKKLMGRVLDGPVRHRPGTLRAQAYEQILVLVMKHGRIDTDLIASHLPKLHSHLITDALRRLCTDGKLNRVMMGIYEPAGFKLDPLTEPKAIEQGILAMVKKRPGIRSAWLRPLLNVPNFGAYKRAHTALREAKKLRIKGTKSAAQFFPVD